MDGLREDIRNEVTPFKPQTIADAQGMALMQETKLKDNHKVYRQNRTSDQSSNRTTRPIPLGVKQLTIDEQRKHRDASLRYNCDDRYHRGHVCKKPAMVLCLEAVEIETEADRGQPEETNIEDQPSVDTEDVTLLTIVGEATPRTIQIQGTVKDTQLEIIIDSSANLNFIHGRWAR